MFDAPGAWWPAEHRLYGPGSTMSFEPRLGAALREEKGGQGLVWYSVTALDPLRSVDMIGHLAARFSGPATPLLHIEIMPAADGGPILLKMTDGVRQVRARPARVAEPGRTAIAAPAWSHRWTSSVAIRKFAGADGGLGANFRSSWPH